MNDKCFCHLNGYRVKDAEARSRISELESIISGMGEGGEVIINSNTFKDVYYLEMPLGLIPSGTNGHYQTALNEECKNILTDFITTKMIQEGIKNPTLVIKNTSTTGEFNGETIQDPTPRTLVLRNEFVTLPEDNVSGIYSFRGIDPNKDGLFLNEQKLENSCDYVLTVNYDVEGSNYVFSSCVISSASYELTTKKYVDDAISSVEAGGVDLTGYATEDYVDQAINELNIPSLNGYATEEYVNTAIGNIDIPESSEVPKVTWTGYANLTNNDGQYSTTEFAGQLKTLLTEYKDKVLDCFDLMNTSTASYSNIYPYKIRFYLYKSGSTPITSMSGISSAIYYAFYYNQVNECYDKLDISVTVSYDGSGNFSGTIGSNMYRDKGMIPTRMNKSAFTPNSNYHLTTKKYVDDTISTSVTNATKTAYYRAKLTTETGTISKDSETTVVFNTADLNVNSAFTLTNGVSKNTTTWCKYAKITAYLNFKATTEGSSIIVRLYKGSTLLNQYGVSCEKANGNMAFTIPDYVVATSQNDEFKITVASGSGTFTVRANSYISIEGLAV